MYHQSPKPIMISINTYRQALQSCSFHWQKSSLYSRFIDLSNHSTTGTYSDAFAVQLLVKTWKTLFTCTN